MISSKQLKKVVWPQQSNKVFLKVTQNWKFTVQGKPTSMVFILWPALKVIWYLQLLELLIWRSSLPLWGTFHFVRLKLFLKQRLLSTWRSICKIYTYINQQIRIYIRNVLFITKGDRSVICWMLGYKLNILPILHLLKSWPPPFLDLETSAKIWPLN